MADARALQRKQPICYLRVFDRNSNRMVGRVIDITTEGVRLVSETPLPENTTVQLRMPMPEAVQPGLQVSFDADVKWSGLDINPEYIDTGLMMTDITDADRLAIHRLVRSYAFHS
ncbi:MAG: hypothetical protein DRP45_02135 [Candidatus Zixiibacteriota bacterium]|nr:MAG: hypothetical protein DRP45_02135 [candidate division Zixibacteria bacterium]